MRSSRVNPKGTAAKSGRAARVVRFRGDDGMEWL